MSKVKRFLQTSSIYFIGSTLSKIVTFLLLPLYTSNLLPEDFGRYDLVVTIISFFIPVVFFQIWDAMFRFSFEKDKKNEKYSVISNGFSVLAFSFMIYSILYWTVFNYFNFEFVWLIFLYGLMIALQYHYTFIARVFLKNKLFVFSGLVNTLISATTNILLILKFNMGIESLYIAAILGCIIQVLMIEVTLHPLKNFRINDLELNRILLMLKFSIPLCIATMSYWLLSGFTKVVIINQIGAYENGLYAIANRFSVMILLIVNVFQYAWNEMAYLMAKETDRKEKYGISIEYIIKVVLIGSAIIILIIKIIYPYLIDSSYQDSLLLVPISIVGVAFNAIAGFLGTIFLTEKQTKYILSTTIISAISNLLFLWIFTSLWGLQGAIGALSLAFIILAFLRIYYMKKNYGIRIPWLTIGSCITLLLVSIFIFFVFDDFLWLLVFIIILSGILMFTLKKLILNLLNKKSKK